jgi:hypothetical protein
MHLLVLEATLSLVEELIAVWEEYLLLLLEVVLKVLEREGKVVTKLEKLWVTVSVRVCHTLNVEKKLRATSAYVAVVNLENIVN